MEEKRAHSTSIYSVRDGELKARTSNSLLISNMELDLHLTWVKVLALQTNNVMGQKTAVVAKVKIMKL